MTVQSFYLDSRACDLVGNVSEWFPVNVGLRETRLCDVSMVVEYMYIWMVWFER